MSREVLEVEFGMFGILVHRAIRGMVRLIVI